MSQDANQDLLDFYRTRINNHGFSYEAMWGDAARWKSGERFRPLLSLPIQPGDVLVDIGCGTGDLALFLKANRIDVNYIGVEAVPEFAQHARETCGAEVIELDVFRDLGRLPSADWYVTFGTLNKSWNIAQLEGRADSERIFYLFDQLYAEARKGFAASLVTDVVDYRKSGVVNMDPVAVGTHLKQMTRHFTVFHGYSFYEFFAAAWRGARR